MVAPARCMTTQSPQGCGRGFSIIESVAAMLVLSLLAGAVLSAVSAVRASQQVADDRLTGRMLAEELIREIDAKKFQEPSDASAPIGPDAGEVNGESRAAFDDIDDYQGLAEKPPRAADGSVLPGLSGSGAKVWSRTTEVVSGTRSDPNAGSPLAVKVVKVTVYRGRREVASVSLLRSGVWEKQAVPGPVQLLVREVTSILAR